MGAEEMSKSISEKWGILYVARLCWTATAGAANNTNVNNKSAFDFTLDIFV
jgi:ribosomal protein L7/L12